MCGFTGILSLNNEHNKYNSIWLDVASNLIAHRGPDSGGSYNDGPFKIAARRLKIHDLSESADQPFVDIRDRYVLCYNGSIFNYKDLRKQLISLNYRFNTESDTEVVLYSLIEWGKAALEKFNGMFTLCFYDKITKNIILARDKLGIKPLYYYIDSKNIIFSSEIKPILMHKSVKREVNKDAVPELFSFQTIMPPQTLFKNIYNLLPGKGIEINKDRVRKEFTYWDIISLIDNENLKYMNIEDSLNLSLTRCWDADRNIGIQLSGGVDSSLITAISHDELNIRNIDTYSVIFDDSKIKYYLPRSEESYINTVSKQFNTNSNLYTFNNNQIMSALAESIWHHELPIFGASTCLYLLLSREIKKHTTVIMTGEGADDIFLGYFSNKKLSNNQSFFKTFCDNNTVLKNFGTNGLESALSSRLDLLNSSKYSKLSNINKTTILTIKSYLHGLLARHDRMFMANGMEGRLPFCTDEMLLNRFSLNDDEIHNKNDGKVIIKKYAEKYFKSEFVYRKKIGFSSPFGDWCADKNIWRGYYDNLSLEFVSEYGNADVIRDHNKLKENKEKWSNQNLNCMFSWINFQTWYEIFFNSKDISNKSAWEDAYKKANNK